MTDKLAKILRPQLFGRWLAESAALPDAQWLIKDFILAGGLTITVGPPKSYKSWLTQLTQLAIASGRKLGPFEPGTGGPRRVLVIDREGVQKPTSQRYQALMNSYEVAADEVTENLFMYFGQPFSLLDPAWVAELYRLVELLEIDVVYCDTFAKVSGGMDENSSRDVGMALEVLEGLKLLARPCAVVLVHHMNKSYKVLWGQQLDPAISMRGSSALAGAYDCLLSVQDIDLEGKSEKVLTRGGKYADFETAIINWNIGPKGVPAYATLTVGTWTDPPRASGPPEDEDAPKRRRKRKEEP